MGFWIFMFICELLIPLTMIGFGKQFRKKSPKNINMIVGYRTSRSMKSKETWEFAHCYFGKLWFRLGWMLLVPTVFGMILVIGKDNDMVGNVGLVINVVQIAVMLIPIYFTEKALKERFG